jgi:hypothetical protein
MKAAGVLRMRVGADAGGPDQQQESVSVSDRFC